MQRAARLNIGKGRQAKKSICILQFVRMRKYLTSTTRSLHMYIPYIIISKLIDRVRKRLQQDHESQ